MSAKIDAMNARVSPIATTRLSNNTAVVSAKPAVSSEEITEILSNRVCFTFDDIARLVAASLDAKSGLQIKEVVALVMKFNEHVQRDSCRVCLEIYEGMLKARRPRVIGAPAFSEANAIVKPMHERVVVAS